YLRLLRARALLALRNDHEAQLELAECCRRDPRCAEAYRLLGELGVRRDEPESAAVFLREALRLDPRDEAAEEWLGVANSMIHKRARARGTESPVRPAAVAEKLPAAAAAAGHFFSANMMELEPASLPLASGFGRYLLEIGIVTVPQLRAALAYK